jgi:hypothetical protein
MVPSPNGQNGDELAQLRAEAQLRAADMAGRRIALREDALSHVVRWQWATDESQLHRLEPMVREREDLRAAKLLAQPSGYYEEYGYDARGRLVVARDGRNIHYHPRYREHLIRHDQRQVAGWTYWSDGEPLWATIFRRDEEGRMRHVVRAGIGGFVHSETYTWQGGRLRAIHHASDGGPAYPGVWRHEVEEVEYDAAGRPTAIYSSWQTRDDSQDRRVVWRSRAAGPSSATLARRVGESMRMHLLSAARSMVAFVPWAAVLYYHHERPLHGSLVVAGADVRDHFTKAVHAAAGDKSARRALWNPAEWLSCGLDDVRQLSLDELAWDLSDLIADYEVKLAGADDDSSAAVKLVRRTAKHLYADLSGALEVTDDFVAYPLDHGLTEIPQAIKATVPRDVLEGYAALLP